MKKNDLYLQIMKEHGIDPKAQANANKLVYEIPLLDMHSKARTPVTQVFKEMVSEGGKITVQKPFEFETAKRMRLQQELAMNEDMENESNERANVRAGKSSAAASQREHEPLCLQVQRNFKLRASDEKPLDDKPRKLTRPISPNLQVDAR